MKIFISRKCISCNEIVKLKYTSIPVLNFPNLQEIIFNDKCNLCILTEHKKERKIVKLKEQILNLEFDLHCLENGDDRIY
jgi:hypothetical protein